jgi:hypothetical protein
LQYIDYTEEILIQEAIATAQLTNGSISFSELKNMDFRSYEMVIRECLKINEKNSIENETIEGS